VILLTILATIQNTSKPTKSELDPVVFQKLSKCVIFIHHYNIYWKWQELSCSLSFLLWRMSEWNSFSNEKNGRVGHVFFMVVVCYWL